MRTIYLDFSNDFLGLGNGLCGRSLLVDLRYSGLGLFIDLFV